jgi:putative membrane protein
MIAMMIWNGGLAWWQAGLMWIAMIAFWALLAWIVYALVTGITRRPDQRRPDQAGPRERPRPGDARQILDERLARGEIGPEEYRRLREVLERRVLTDQSP